MLYYLKNNKIKYLQNPVALIPASPDNGFFFNQSRFHIALFKTKGPPKVLTPMIAMHNSDER